MKSKMLKSVVWLCMSFAMFFNLGNTVSAKNNDEYVEIVQDDSNISRAVSQTGSILLAAGDYFSIDFKMNKWTSDDHNAFNVKVSDFDCGSAKVKIEGSNGYSWESDFVNKDTTFVTSNAKPDVTYTVTIQASIPEACRAKYSITSYIK